VGWLASILCVFGEAGSVGGWICDKLIPGGFAPIGKVALTATNRGR
jgi:hypothetical protein